MATWLTRPAAALAAGALLAPVAAGSAGAATRARARAAAFAVQVIVPQGTTTVRGGLELARGTDSASGRWASDAAPGLVSVGSYAIRVRAHRAPTASAETSLASVSALGGLVRASSVTLGATAGVASGAPDDELTISLQGLRVAGRSVTVRANRVVRLPDLGSLTIDEQVESRAATMRRGFVTALHVRLSYPYRGLPAGTEVLIGFADAGVSIAKAAQAAPGAGVLTSSAGQAAAPAATTAAGSAAPAAGSATPLTGHLPTGDAESPPPGGFTRSPPIGSPVRARLLAAGGFRFPVVGGATFSDDFGAPRADTGFHQGIDLFAPVGTPVVAVHDGTLFNVGWNRLGGNRLWLDDGVGDAFYYAHLSAYAPTAVEGASVRAGDVIGFVGATGDAVGTPPHLHFEIHPGGSWAVPPFAYVTAWKAQGTTLAPPDASSSPLGVTGSTALQFVASPLETNGRSTDLSSLSGLDLAAIAALGSAAAPEEGSVPAPSPLGSPSATSGLGFGSLD